jgi:hypothetical protein
MLMWLASPADWCVIIPTYRPAYIASSLMPDISQAAGKLNDLLDILQVDKWMQLQDRRGRLPQH